MGETGGTGSLEAPVTIDDVTPAWLSAAIGATVASVKVEPIGAAVGFLGQLARMHLAYAGDAAGPASVIVKLPTTDEATRGLADIYRFYEREGGFYRHLAPTPNGCGVPVPKCFAVVGEANDVALVLEDLQGIREGDQVAGASTADLERALRTAATLHAAWWDNPALDTLDWMPAPDDPVNKSAAVNYPLCWPFFVEHFGHMLNDGQRAIGEALCSRMEGLLDHVEARPHTVNHGDFRLDNLFFPDGDGPCMVIDWQVASRGHTGSLDVAYFLSGNVDPVELERDFASLLHCYHDALVGQGVAGFSFADLEASMRWATLICIAYPVLGCTVLQQDDPRAVALFDRMIHGYFGLAETLDAGSLL
jgi:aminoglycoside/choline kinase family phosphotransferase